MKQFMLFFTVYLILLSILPCQDREDRLFDQLYTAQVNADTADANHLHAESCPPFCSCACCSVGQYFPMEQTSLAIVPEIEKTFSGFHLSDLKSQPSPIWQPPKLV